MKLSSSVLALIYAATAVYASYVIPADAPDGLYTVSDDGTLTYLGPGSDETAARRALPMHRRATSGVVCQSLTFTQADQQAAVTALANFFGSGNSFFKAISSKSGTAVRRLRLRLRQRVEHRRRHVREL